MDVWPFVARDAELGVVLGALTGRRPRSVLLSGAAGVGKSRLAAEAAIRLARLGRGVGTARATLAARDVPYGALAHLVPAEMPSETINPVRWAADQLAPGADTRRVLVVDDAHLLDAASAAVVHHVVQYRHLPVLATVRRGVPAPDAIAALTEGGRVTLVDVPALSADDTALIVGGALAGPVEPAAVEQLSRLAEGNALLLREIVRAAQESGALIGPPWRLHRPVPVASPRLTELISARVGSLDEDEADVLDYVALAEPLPVHGLIALSSTTAVERCERRGLIRVTDQPDGSTAWLAHPLYGEAIRAGRPTLRLRRQYRDLVAAAESADGPQRAGEQLRLAIWKLEADLPQDPSSVLAAARLAWAAHDYPLAHRLADAAVDAGAGIEAAVLLATMLNYTGQGERAAAMLADVPDEAPMTPRVRTDLALTRAGALAMTGRVPEAIALLEQTQRRVTDIELGQNLEVLHISLSSVFTDARTLLRRTSALLAAPPASAPLLAQALCFHSGALGILGRFTESREAARRAVSSIDTWRDAVPVIVVPLHMAWFSSSAAAGDLTDAELALTLFAAEIAGGLGFDFAENALVFGRAHLATVRGRLSDAAALATTSRPGPGAVLCHAQRAIALALAGESHRAAEALHDARAGEHMLGGPEEVGLGLAAAAAAAATGDVGRALDIALDQAARAQARGLPANELFALHAAVRLGAADRVLDRLVQLTAPMQGALPALCAEHCRAVAETDGPGLLAVASRYDELGFLVSAADAAAQAAAAFAAVGGAPGASTRLAAARAAALADRCQGLRSPALLAIAAPGLTPRERQVATLAAAGRTNQRIAADLTLSVRTVENHLQHVYDKLGVTSREDLTGLL